QKLKNNKDKWAKEIQDYHYKKSSELKEKYNSEQDKHFFKDIKYHLTYLSEAISLNSLTLFENYINWTKVLFENIDISLKAFEDNLKYIEEILAKKLNNEELDILKNYLHSGVKILNQENETPESHINKDNPLYSLATKYLNILLDGNRRKASELILKAVEEGAEIKDIYLNVFQPVQREIGRLWQLNKVSIAKEHYFTSVTQLIMSQLYKYILNSEKKNKTSITTCVGDELHELGIRMIADLLEMEGWNTIHLGANIPIKDIVDEIEKNEADILAISVTMVANLKKAEKLINEVKANEKIKKTKVMVGGYAFNINKDLWKEIGADGYAEDLKGALELAPGLLKEKGDKNEK
ncbi:MAG: cobalamin B12-binding domain-containing protein, partial [Bacillota bacterium]